MDKKNIGHAYEDIAAEYLKINGHEILQRNFFVKDAEIDIISREKQSSNNFGINEYIVFTEVKFRTSSQYGEPFEAVGIMKQKKICRAAMVYLKRYGFSTDTPVRFDVISIVDNEVLWIPNAFEFVR